MKVCHLLEARRFELLPCVNKERVEQIMKTLKAEIASGKRNYWNLKLDVYFDERLGDLDLASAIELDMENDDGSENPHFDLAYDETAAYIKQELTPLATNR